MTLERCGLRKKFLMLNIFLSKNACSGRSIVFASWDGEEYGGLGSTSWLYRHSKELGSRGVTYINMDHLLQGADDVHVPSSPLLKEVIFQAAKAVSCTSEDKANDSRYGN